MIRAIHIKNLSVIESASVDFSEGFLVISGETGSGKSILVTAIHFVLGARVDSDLLRSGQEEAAVTLSLDIAAAPQVLPLLAEAGVTAPEDSELFLRRTLNAAGRSRAFINDQPVTMKTMQAIGQSMVHLVAQHAAADLMREDFLLRSIDQSGSLEATERKYRSAHQEHRAAKQERAELQAQVEQIRQQEDFLRFQFQELSQADLKVGEEEELESQKQRVKHKVALAESNYQMRDGLLESDGSVLSQLGKIRGIAQKAAGLDAKLQSVADLLGQAEALIQDGGRILSEYEDALQEDPGELDRMESRLAYLAELKRKYRLDIPQLIEKAEASRGQIAALENFDDALAKSESRVGSAREALLKSGKTLAAERKKAATALEKKLAKILQDLALPHARVEFRFEKFSDADAFKASGPESLCLWVAFNPGEEAQPMSDVISGGELSRLLLAFCEVLYPAGELGTMVFDEVDTGVGGRVAELIGKKLEDLSRKTQVFCVTHLPQIACHAEQHYSVVKEVKAGRTYTRVLKLSPDERVQEIARMLAGVKITEQALKHARELLKNAAA